MDSEHVSWSEDGGICLVSANIYPDSHCGMYCGWRANMYHKVKVDVDAVLLPLSLSHVELMNVVLVYFLVYA